MNERDEMAAGATGALKDTGSSARESASAENSDLNQRNLSPLSTPKSPLPRIPDYELLRRIGGGSYGEVWLARSTTGALRALKIVWRHTFEDDRPFQREFEGIQRFERISREHPGQLALYHVGRGDGYFYYVMELADSVPGLEFRFPSSPGEHQLGTRNSELETYVPHTLRHDLQTHGRLPAARVLELGLALTEAVGHLHAHGLVHRDIKPSNIIFVNGRPKLADIGLVTDAGDAHSIVGTEGYLALEGPGTPQADLFALGKVLYEAATGMDRRKFPQLPPGLRDWPDARLVFELNEIFLKACAADVRQRYANAEAVHADLERLCAGESVKRRQTLQRRWAVCKKAGLALIGVAAIAASAVLLLRQFTRLAIPTDGPRSVDADGPRSVDPEANRLCDTAMNIVRGDRYDEFAKAYTNLYQAIELDTNFAKPYVGLLELRLREVVPALGPRTEGEMHTIARKLKELAPPNLAATYCAQSVVNWFEWNFPQAMRFVQQAIKADPKYELGQTWYGFMLCICGDPIKSREQYKIGQTLAPAKATIYRGLGRSYYVERRYTNAIPFFRTALEQNRRHCVAYYYVGQVYQAMRDYTNAIDNFEQERICEGQNEFEMKQRYDALRRAFEEGGERGYWQERWNQTERNPAKDFYDKAVIQLHLGNTNAALGWLEKAYETEKPAGSWHDDIPLHYVLHDDCWDGLHEHPQFKSVLEKMGFTKVMPSKKK